MGGGHHVSLWAPTPPAAGSLATNIRLGTSAVWARPSLSELRARIRDLDVEIVHFHNLFPLLSPAAVRVAAESGAAVILTLHNYRYSCLPAVFFRDDRPCEDCLGKVPWRGVVHRCYRDSVMGSASLAASLTLHRALGSFGAVDLFIAISEFVKQKHLEAGLPAKKIRVKTHFSKAAPRRDGMGDFFLYLGRLSPEKGLDGLLTAWSPALGKLVVAGDGPDRARLETLAPRGVEFAGAIPAGDVPEIIAQARAVVVPSRSYEGAGKVVMESFAAGVPVVARRIGALGEVVEDERSGLLVEEDDPESWRRALTLMRDGDRNRRMGNAAYEQWRSRFSPSSALVALEESYKAALEIRRISK